MLLIVLAGPRSCQPPLPLRSPSLLPPAQPTMARDMKTPHPKMCRRSGWVLRYPRALQGADGTLQ